MTNKSIRVIFDTNVWISFLIGKRLSWLKHSISNGEITIVTTARLLLEIQEVTKRKKIRKYFPSDSVAELMELLETIADNILIKPTYSVSRDPKDNFLLDLCHYSRANFLVTGDKDLLEHDPFRETRIVTPADFEKELRQKDSSLPE